MAASPRGRRFFKITMLCLLVSSSRAAPDKLSPRQKAPEYARNSGGRALFPPASGQTPANVGRLNMSGPKQDTASISRQASQQDTAQKDESVSYKEVNGESVRIVSGNYGYESPEGLPVSFKYTANENGNKASFTIGTAAGGGTRSKLRPSSGIQTPKSGSADGNSNGPKGGTRSGTGTEGRGQGTTGSGGEETKRSDKPGGAEKLPGNGDRKYLPPN